MIKVCSVLVLCVLQFSILAISLMAIPIIENNVNIRQAPSIKSALSALSQDKF